MNLEKSTPELFTALAAAQQKVENAIKGSVNTYFASKYADLSVVLNTVRPVFTEHGISIVQGISFDGDHVSVTTALAHVGGGYITSVASCCPAKADAQGIGAASTYLRRYGLSAMCGIAQEDDDGNAAQHSYTHDDSSESGFGKERALIDGATTLDELQTVWRKLSPVARTTLMRVKNTKKLSFEQVDG